MAVDQAHIGQTYVVPGIGVVVVTQRYRGWSVAGETDDAPVIYVELRFLENTAATPQMREDVFLRRARDLMSPGLARQVLGVLNNRQMPPQKLTPPIRYLRGQGVLQRQDPIEMAKFLREILVRGRGVPGAPIQLPPKEQALRDALIAKLAVEIDQVLPGPSTPWDARQGSGAYLAQLQPRATVRLNPASSEAAIQGWQLRLRTQPTQALLKKLGRVGRALQAHGPRENPNKQQGRAAQQIALLRELEKRTQEAP